MKEVKLCNNFQLSVTPVTTGSDEELYQVELMRDNEIVMSRELCAAEYQLFMSTLQPKSQTAA